MATTTSSLPIDLNLSVEKMEKVAFILKTTAHPTRIAIVQLLAAHDSLSVQHTLYAIGEAILEKFTGVEEIAFSLPNIHCLPIDMTKFGQPNDNRIFVPTDEPHGLIEARLSR